MTVHPSLSNLHLHHLRLPAPAGAEIGDGLRALRVPCVADVEASDLEGRDPLASLRSANLEALAPHPRRFQPVVAPQAVEVGAVVAEGEAALDPLAHDRQPPAGADQVQGLAVALAPRGGAHVDLGGAVPHSPAHSDQVWHRPLYGPVGGA